MSREAMILGLALALTLGCAEKRGSADAAPPSPAPTPAASVDQHLPSTTPPIAPVKTPPAKPESFEAACNRISKRIRRCYKGEEYVIDGVGGFKMKCWFYATRLGNAETRRMDRLLTFLDRATCDQIDSVLDSFLAQP
jgi:hypothetical protein